MFHVVKPKETCRQVARLYRITEQRLKRLNPTVNCTTFPRGRVKTQVCVAAKFRHYGPFAGPAAGTPLFVLHWVH